MSSEFELKKLRKQAESLALSGNWGQEAIEINTKILEIHSLESGAHTRLAQCFKMKGEYFRAYYIFRNVLNFDPKNNIARNQSELIREDALRQKKEIEKDALRQKKKIEEDARIEQEKNDISGINNFHEAYYLGLAAKRRRRFDLAIAALIKATELNPESLFAWNALGSACCRKRNAEEALRAFQHGYELGGGNVSLVGIATVDRMIGNLEAAIDLYKKVLGQDPNNVYALNGLAAAYHDAGKFEDAQNFFDCAFAAKQSKSRTNAVNYLKELGRTSKLNGDDSTAERITRWLNNLKQPS